MNTPRHLTSVTARRLLERLYAKECRVVSHGKFSMWRINSMILECQHLVRTLA